MRILIVSAEINGNMVPVGTITEDSPGSAVFQYLPEYRETIQAHALSISLPVREEPYSSTETAAFFEGLLPEGFTRRLVAQWMHADEGDYLSLLHGLGRECLGAICVSEAGERSNARYEPITEQQVRDLAAEGASKSAEIVTSTHLSLTGASGKVGLYYAQNQNAWYLPQGTAPSTHIVKLSHVRLDNIIANERLALRTAELCGISVPESFIMNTGTGRDQDLLFATKRYDRIFSPKAQTINNLPRPYRLHQEDFAQAMGIYASQKYESGNAGYMKSMFEILRKHSADPITDMTSLWDMIVFNYLIGNTDAHVKNFSLLYSSDWRSIRLAPAYDIISTVVYDQSTRDMAFGIGGVHSLDEITLDSFRSAAHEVGIGERMAMQRLEKLCDSFAQALTQAADELADAGYTEALKIKERILQAGGVRNT